MRIVVVGTGGVGGYFGGLLAYSGQEVTFIARGQHMRAIQAHGLQVNSIHGDFVISPSPVTDDMGAVGRAELVLVCVKDFHLGDVIPAMKPLVGRETTILPMLNGIRAAEQLIEAFGRDKVLGGNCSVVAFVAKPGTIQQTSAFRRVAFGEWNGAETARTRAIFDIFQATGVDVELSADVRKTMWTKYLFITAYSGVASVVRLPAASIHACPETMEMLQDAMKEIAAVALARGVSLDENVVESTMAFVRALPPEATSSMQRDVEAGRPSELEALTGYLVRQGIEMKVPTPVNTVLYAALKPLELHAQQMR